MRRFLYISFTLLCLHSSAQSNRWLEARTSHGFFIPHRNTLPQLLTGHANTLELSYVTQTEGSQSWHQDYKGPEMGIGFYYMDLGNDHELGKFLSLYPFLALPLVGESDHGLVLRMGVGLAYLTKTYVRQENMFNTAIGSHVNYSFHFALRYQRDLGRIRLGTGLSLSHASNASIRLPNLGANVVAADLTLAWRMNQEKRIFTRTDMRTTEGKEALALFLSLGMRQSDSFLNNEHGVQELRLNWERDFSPKLSYSLGADIIHNRATYQEFKTDTLSGLFFLQTGLNMGIKMRFGTASLFLQNGFYLSQGMENQGGLYHRFGGRKDVGDRCVLELSLKTHYAKADYLAIGFGYKLKSKTRTWEQ